jgi:hypothetical protein
VDAFGKRDASAKVRHHDVEDCPELSTPLDEWNIAIDSAGALAEHTP